MHHYLHLRFSATMMIGAMALFSSVAAAHVQHAPAVFTQTECEAIVQLFSLAEAEHDERMVPMLPNMDGGFAVSRINRFLPATDSRFDWIYERLLGVLPALQEDDMHSFRSQVAFNLLHEFHGTSNTFDWHADTKPGDGKERTNNLNVMLSAPGKDFGGGTLQVGAAEVSSRQGDAVLYAAALPHRVHPLAWGRRYTLVIALAEGTRWSTVATSTAGATDLPRPGDRRGEYWHNIEMAFDEFARGSLSSEPKLHILHGEFLEGLGGRAEDVQQCFCRAYRANATAAREHSDAFYSEGVAKLQGSQIDLDQAESYFAMAACVSPEHDGATAALGVVREAMAIRASAKSTGGGVEPMDGHD